jgi:CHAD domain-containing protein
LVALPATELVTPANAIVVPLPTFRLQAGEPLGDGLKRLSLDSLESAVSGFYDGEEAFGMAVHQARKTTKQLRALLRLVRSEVGEKAYRFESAEMSGISAMISAVRSSAVRVESVAVLRDLYGSFLAPDTFAELSERLQSVHARQESRVMEDPVLVANVVDRFERAHDRYSSWPTDETSREVYGRGIRDSYEAIGSGLTETFRKGRHQMVAAYQSPSPARFHQWRKRVKNFWYQMEILTPLWPEVVLGMAITLDRIGALLGQDHDLADLLETVSSRIDLCPNPVERSLLKALAEQRRSDLETASRILGRRIYAETAKSLNTRFEAFWDSARDAHELRATALPV